MEHVLAWHCILLASLQVHLHGDGACLGLHVGLGFSAPRVSFNMTRQPDVNTAGAVVATPCHMASLQRRRWRLRAGLVAQHRLRRSALQCPHGAIGGGGNSTPSSVGSRARSRTEVSSPVAGLGVVPRCRRRRPSQCTRGAVVVSRQPGLTMLGGVIAGSGASVGRQPGLVWCRLRPDLQASSSARRLHHVLVQHFFGDMDG